jgi:hypothetical protein
MSPADIPVEWPTPREIADAVFAAAALEGEDAIEVILGKHSARSRAYAFLALAHRFPTAPRAKLGRKCGNPAVVTGTRTALRQKAWPWFDIGRLNAVRAACRWGADDDG